MPTRVQWLGHACLLVESGGQRILIDPFLTGNPAAFDKQASVA
jgi:L-ascorbate metabolism protein UlaG (beta-lactamase superfamily)